MLILSKHRERHFSIFKVNLNPSIRIRNNFFSNFLYFSLEMETKRLTLGYIVFWALIRLAITIVGLWILFYYIDYGTWWMLGIVSLYVIVIHPIFIQYDIFREKSKPILSSTLCSSCKYFDETAILCTALDEHPDENYLPCKGELWEPKNFESEL